MDPCRFVAALLLLTFGTAGAAILSPLAAWTAAPLLFVPAVWIATRPRS
jgi:hypothetical protein